MDPYSKQDLIEAVGDALIEDNALDAIIKIAAAYEVDLYDLEVPTDGS
jgi:hypothetical protein